MYSPASFTWWKAFSFWVTGRRTIVRSHGIQGLSHQGCSLLQFAILCSPHCISSQHIWATGAAWPLHNNIADDSLLWSELSEWCVTGNWNIIVRECLTFPMSITIMKGSLESTSLKKIPLPQPAPTPPSSPFLLPLFPYPSFTSPLPSTPTIPPLPHPSFQPSPNLRTPPLYSSMLELSDSCMAVAVEY